MKKILATFMLSALMGLHCAAFAAAPYNGHVTAEHLQLSEKVKKEAPTDVVINTNGAINVIEHNVIEVTFAENFSTKNFKPGDTVKFLLNDGLKTTEGTRILPAGTKIISTVGEIDKPKMFNKSGKVSLVFHSVEMPNGAVLPLSAKIFSNKEKLSRGKLNTLGKGMGSTLGAMGAGVGAGCGIGVAAGAVIVGGFAIGLPVGFAVGSIIGLVTPGLHYKAKAGDKLVIQLTGNLEVSKNEEI